MTTYILDQTRGFRGRILISTCLGVLRVILGLIFVAISKRTVDIATGNVSGPLGYCITGLVVVIISELICSAIANRTTELSEAEMKNNLQKRLFSRLLTASWTGKEKLHSGDSLSRLTDDCRVASECLCRTLPALIIAAVQLIGAFFFLWYLSPLLAVILMVILPLFISAGRIFFRRMRNLSRQIREAEGRLQGEMQERLHHRLLLLAYRHTERTVEVISALHNSRLNFIRRRADITMYSRTVVFAGFEIGYLVAFLWGIRGLCLKTISLGTMTAYLQLAGQIQRPLSELSQLLPGLIQSHTAIQRIAEIDEMTTGCESYQSRQADSGKSAGLSLNPAEAAFDPAGLSFGAGLSFNNVSFSYPDGTQIFKQFSHTFTPGSKTAIMGETGVGKSTLLLLALGIIGPQEGRIDVLLGSDRQPVSSLTRSLFVYVPQGNTLLSGTIRDNLRLGKQDATEEEMRQALHDAAADFVFDLSSGLDTICGEHGYGLSEGQAQRISIARALLCPGSILLLDEISSSLDETTEKNLLTRLSAKLSLHTIIYVTHRTTALPYCDTILTLKNL